MGVCCSPVGQTYTDSTTYEPKHQNPEILKEVDQRNLISVIMQYWILLILVILVILVIGFW